ncbi:MAG: hypothetical protein QOK23_1100 [Gammaproteobacteria bacterium]|jgi:hypothetical protein|nr:hypothetical protein [Gammaproteobacteria bacterium]MEA3138931.1 hypothetical protein [Gammaproteobacteria bacterium]
MKARSVLLKVAGGIGAFIGYGCLAVFLYVIGTQIYKWFRDGEWTRIGMGDGIRIVLTHCCVKDGDSGRIANFLQWWESPATWLGLHKVLEVVPVSLALFALSIIGNCVFIFCQDQLRFPRRTRSAIEVSASVSKL